MKLIIKLTISILLIAGLFGCASPRMNLSVPSNKNIIVEDNKSLVYFIRPKALGFAIHAAVYDNDKFIGFVPYNQKLPYITESGEHLFMVVSEAADFMKANLIPGKTYYAEVVPRMGAWRARFSLAPITGTQLGTEKVRKWINDAQLIQNNELAYQWADNNHNSVLEKKRVYFEKWLSKDEDKRPLLRANDGE